MNVFRLDWLVLYLLGFVVASLCTNGIEYEGNYADNYDNEISQDQQEEVSPTPCHAAEFSRWEKLFIALEDSHMRQNMLLESLEQCCGGMIHLRTQGDKLVPSVASACGAQVEQVNVRLQREMDELREEEVERETRLNATLQMLLSSSRESNAWMKRLEEGEPMPPRVADSRVRHLPTPRPGGLGTKNSRIPSDLKEQEATAPLHTTTVERVLVVMTTEMEKVHLLLNRVIAQVEMLRREHGDT